MKTILSILFFLIIQLTFSQRFIKSGDNFTIETEFFEQLELKSKKKTKHFEFLAFEQIKQNDSIITSGIVSVGDKNVSSLKNENITLLNKKIKPFFLPDTDKKLFTPNNFLGKTTLVCLWNTIVSPKNDEIWMLKRLLKKTNIQVVAFVSQRNMNSNLKSSINFPLILGAERVIKEQFKSKSSPQYLVINEKGEVSFILPFHIMDTRIKYNLMNPLNKKVYNQVLKAIGKKKGKHMPQTMHANN